MPAKLAVILLLIVLIRIGSSYPLPFVNGDYMRGLLGMQGLAFLNAMTGGSMQQMSLFALSISPYITASIIMQLMTVIVPGIEEMQKDGQDRIVLKTSRESWLLSYPCCNQQQWRSVLELKDS